MRTSEYRNVTRMIRKDVNFLNALDDVYLASCLPEPAKIHSRNPEDRWLLSYRHTFETIRFDLEEEKLIYERRSKDRTPKTLKYLYELKENWRRNPDSIKAIIYRRTLEKV